MTPAPSFIAELIRQKEDRQIEFLGDYQSSEILEVICSFLNADGGWVIIGYDGRQFCDLPVNLPEKVSELKALINEQIFPQPLVDVRTETYRNNQCILINVIKGARQP